MTDSDKPPSVRAQRVAVVYNTDYSSLDIADEDAEPPSRAADAEVAETARAVGRSLAEAGFDVVTMTVSDSLFELPERLADAGADVVFNLVESLGGDPHREAELPALLDRIGMKYTGNQAAALSVAHAKDIARARLTKQRVPVAAGFAVEDADQIARGDWTGLRFPLFVKPARTDASIGIDQGSIVHDVAALRRRLEWLERVVAGPYLVEEYLPGREINVAIFPEPVRGRLVPTEIDFSSYPADYAPIVTYDCKWVPDCPEANAFSRACSDTLPDKLLRRVIEVARGAFLAIGGTSYGRVDMRLDARGLPRVIDVNPNPDIHPEAGLCIAAQSVGMSHSSLVTQLVAGASLKVQDAVQADSKRRSRTARRALGVRR